MIETPDYSNIVLAFTYHHFRLEIDQSEENGQAIFSVWASHDRGCAVAVPKALSRTDAIRRAKRWVDRRLAQTY